MKYKKNDIVKGKVTGIEDYGIFVLLDDNITGLIHISEISSAFVRNVSDYVEIGEIIYAKVLETDEENRKVKLSLKRFENQNDTKKLHPIKETESGFAELKKSLDKWIDKKEKELIKKEDNSKKG